MSKGDQTRQRIIAQAAPLFNQLGFKGCSMHDVMAATGLEKGGLYRHFSSKEDLAAEAFAYSLKQAIATRAEGFSEVRGSIPQLRFAVRRFVEIPSPVPGGCPLFNAAVDSDDGNPILRALASEALRTWRRRLTNIVRTGIRQGEIRNDTSARQIANTIISTLEGALVLSRLEGDRTPLHDAETSLNLILDSISLI